MMELTASNTHLYPGSRLKAVGQTLQAEGDVTILYSDGATASAKLKGQTLTVEPYKTAAGTKIAQKQWQLRDDGDTWIIAKRLD